MSPAMFLLKIVLAIQGLLWVHMIFKNFRGFSVSVKKKKKGTGIFDEECTESVACLG